MMLVASMEFVSSSFHFVFLSLVVQLSKKYSHFQIQPISRMPQYMCNVQLGACLERSLCSQADMSDPIL